MIKINRRTALAMGAASVTFPCAAIGQSDSRPTISVAVQNITTSNTLEMRREQSNVGTRIFRNYVEPMVDTDWIGDMALQPGLATGWSRIDDKTVEFKLRQGVTFHNGDRLTAEDVAFTFGPDLMWGGGSREVPEAVIGGALRTLPAFDRMEVIDANTVRYHSKVPDLVIEGRMARTAAVIANRRASMEAADWMTWARKPVGTGPYSIAEYRPDQILEMEAFDAHWQGRPPIKRLRFVEVPEVASRINMIRSGEVEFACDIPPDQIDTIEGDGRYEVVGGPINNTRYTVFNKSNPVLRNPLVRRALTHAVDRELIVEVLWAGRTAVPRGLQWEFYGDYYITEHENPQYDIDEAKALLREAGYKGEPIPYKLLNNYYTNQVSTAQINVESWRAAGLNVQIQVVENWGQINEGSPEERGIHDWSAAAVVPDPVIQMSGSWGRLGSPWTRGQWQNEEFGELADELETSTDHARRRQIWARMLTIIEHEDPAYVVLHRNANFTAKRADIGWKSSQSFTMDFRAHNWTA